MDAVNYIEKVKAVLSDEIEEAMLKRYMVSEDEFNNDIANINVNEEEIL